MFILSLIPSDKMPKRVLDSKGYAYDYGSIMHYGNKFFSKNGRPTIKIRKIGRKAHVRIGQRRGLSFLDIAQVMAMYDCHKKKLNASGNLQQYPRVGGWGGGRELMCSVNKMLEMLVEKKIENNPRSFFYLCSLLKLYLSFSMHTLY